MVRSLFSLLSRRQTNILSGATILMVAVFGSKFLGLIRDRLLVHNFDTATASIFFAAFSLPDLLFQLLIFGTLSVAFIPVFTEYLNKQGEKEAFSFASDILNLSFFTFTVVCIIAAVFVSPINSLLVPGFEGGQKELTDHLTRLILIGQVVLVIGSFFFGVAQSFQRFFIPALAPLFYNLGIIFGIWILSPFLGIQGPAFGVIIGAFLHVLVQIPVIKALGFKYTFSFNFFNSGVREVFKLMSIRTLGLAVEQLNERVGIALASLISASSVTLLTFSQHLQVVPIGLFGATIAQAALPVLSASKARGEINNFKFTLLTTMHQILFLTLPAAAILIVLRIPVVRLVFGASQFSWDDTVLTGRTVALLSLGLTAQSIVLLLVRGFYAYKDTKTPVIVSFITVFINIILSVVVIKVLRFDVWGLGLSYAVASNVSVLLLLYFLSKTVGGFDLKMLISPALRMFLAAVVAAAVLYIPMKLLDQLVFDTTKTINLIFLTGIASFLGITIYIALVWFMKVQEVYTFANLLKRIYRARFKIETEEIVKESGTV